MNHLFLSFILLLASSSAVIAASITGNVSDENGQPIAQSSLCLSQQAIDPQAAPKCLQTLSSDSSGNYIFNAVEAGAYVVTIIDSRYPTFTWLPVARKLTVAKFSDQVTGLNFKRQFSFSNFQQQATISGADLPELSGFNLDQDTVFLKVYAVDPANPTQQTVFFMGRVTSNASLKIAASAPWTVKEVVYEIFSPAAARQGSLIIRS